MALKQEPPDLDPDIPEDDITNYFESVWVTVKTEDGEGGAGAPPPQLPTQPPTQGGGVDIPGQWGSNNKLPKKKEKPEKPRKRPKPTTILRCTQCEFTTVYGNSLKFHKMSHSDEKPFACNKCDFATKFEQALTRHKKFQHGELNTKPKIFTCAQCGYTTMFKANLQKHEKKHLPEKEFKCPVVGCAYETIYKHHLIKHNRIHHEEPRKSKDKKDDWFQCHKCPYRAQFHGHITRHLEKIHNEVVEGGGKHSCEYCQSPYKDKWKLKVHKQRSVMQNGVKCNYCTFVTVYKCQMQKHKKVHVNELGLVQGKIFTDMALSSESIVSKNVDSYSKSSGSITFSKEDGVLKCNKCPFKTVYELEINSHFVDVHSACKICLYCFVDKATLKIHEQKSKSEHAVKCTVCDFESVYRCAIRVHSYSHYSEFCGTTSNNGEEFDNSLNSVAPSSTQKEGLVSNSPRMYYPNQPDFGQKLVKENKFGKYILDPTCVDWQTIQVHESSNEILRFRCPLCEYGSKFKASVQRHFQRHHTGNSNRPYRCINCNLAVKTKDAISKHNSKSQSEVTMQCKICPFTTNYKCAYTAHQKLHYVYKCNVCNYNYRTKYDLVRHVDEKHLKQGMECRFCGFIASRKESIICHEMKHTGVKPFKCSVCGYASIRKAVLDAHLVKYHPAERTARCISVIDRSIIALDREALPQAQTEPPVEPQSDPSCEPQNDPSFEPRNEGKFESQDDAMDDARESSDDDVVEVIEQPQFDTDVKIEPDSKSDVKDALKVYPPEGYMNYEFLDSAWEPNNSDDENDTGGVVMTVDLKDEVFACDHCDFTSPSQKQLASHITKEHALKERYNCHKCKFKTSNRAKYLRHCEKHEARKVLHCKRCPYKTKLKKRMTKHLEKMHNRRKSVKCEHCGVLSKDKSVLKVHLKKSACKHPIKCSICDYVAVYKCILKKHKMTHYGESFKSGDRKIKRELDVKEEKVENSDNSDNESINIEDEVFKCEKCEFETISERQLLKHVVKDHDGCKRCGKSFDSKTELEEHVLNNISEDLHKCHFCDYDSHYQCATYKHMCDHFREYFEPNELGSLQDLLVKAIEDIDVTATKEEQEMEEIEEPLEKKIVKEGYKLRKNKFGPYLVNLTCVDLKTFRVKRSQDPSRPFQCPLCVFTTRHNHSIKRHIQRHHFDETYRPYKCIDCDFSTTTTDAIAIHNKRKRSTQILYCNSCKFKTKNRCTLNFHHKKHFSFKCLCNSFFQNRYRLISHFATAHLGRRFKCKFCDYVSMRKDTINYHETKHTGMKVLLCTVCGYEANRPSVLEAHYKKYHSDKPSGIKAEIDDPDYNLDIKTETVICDHCGFTTTDKLSLVSHIKRKHNELFMCDECGFTTPYKGSLKTHSQTHLKPTVFKCIKCPFESSFKGHMIRHIHSLHTNNLENKITRDVCDYCNVRQKSYYLRKKHQLDNRSEKALQCAECGFEAFYHCQMEVHKQTHDESVAVETAPESALYYEETVTDRTFRCRYCDFVASKKEALTRHEAAHTGEKPFKCNLCDYASTTQPLLLAHWKKYHGTVVPSKRRKKKAEAV